MARTIDQAGVDKAISGSSNPDELRRIAEAFGAGGSVATAPQGSNTGVGRGLANSNPANSPIDDINRQLTAQLSTQLGDLGSFKDREKSILEKFADRKTLAGAGGNAERELIGSESKEGIEGQLENNARSLIDFREQGSGFATQKVAMDFLMDTGKKRVRELEKARDNLLLQSKVAEAGRLDNLIAQEEEAITNARTNFVDQLTKIGTEARNIASFETPEQARTRQLDITKQEQEYAFNISSRQAIQNLSATAPDAGIIDTDTYQEAINKYRNSRTYQINQELGELQIKQANADIEQSLASASNSRASASNSRSLGGGGGGGGVDFSSVEGISSEQGASLNNAFSNIMAEYGKGSSVDQSKLVRSTFDSYLKSGNIEQAQIYLKSLVKAGLKSEQRGKVASSEEATASLTRLSNLLNNYKEQGGETGLLKGTLESIAQKVGRTSDPKLASIGNEIQTAIQNYRKAISGAAFTESESKEYKAIFPSLFSGSELNSAKIEGAINAIGSNRETFYRNAMGASNYDAVYGASNFSDTATGSFSGGSSVKQESKPESLADLFSSFLK